MIVLFIDIPEWVKDCIRIVRNEVELSVKFPNQRSVMVIFFDKNIQECIAPFNFKDNLFYKYKYCYCPYTNVIINLEKRFLPKENINDFWEDYVSSK
jgi:hypothetical protein